MKQINNLTIKYSKIYKKWQVITPDKRVLKEFSYIEEAEEYAKNIKDFKKKKLEKINSIEKLCELVNAKFGYKINDIGSVEHYQDMCENSIVQIANQYRGTVQLCYGTNKTLALYLKGILEDRIKLKEYK